MNKKISYISISISISVMACFSLSDVSGQTRCPVGVQTGSAQCLPDEEGSAPPRPTGEWIKTWGALVSSNQGHGAWTSKGKFTEDEARQDALGRCHSTGLSDCTVDATYFNQCVAVVSSFQRELSIAKAKDESIAGKAALMDCQKRGNSQCTVEFSDCTDPFFRKF
ncbi:DUF4189 domain-containing protein [Xanthomonas hyacinthi]|uniref:DUF4189 domain-containing protein n=1 Tax=Xanthomonas hyacinthi TaxID=56455 RepID=A0A2S7EZG2_9XANT|nr:DUF4189 domain-containing protein [Xanthomonas hyacinthi]PPU98557.1 hypothetical protein XhyaCFBP1156_07475 [Xanthomonas hyacinthi]QGY75217.1 DUF4189 domain-containing protein [Xanthomonas hyacinthi]